MRRNGLRDRRRSQGRRDLAGQHADYSLAGAPRRKGARRGTTVRLSQRRGQPGSKRRGDEPGDKAAEGNCRAGCSEDGGPGQRSAAQGRAVVAGCRAPCPTRKGADPSRLLASEHRDAATRGPVRGRESRAWRALAPPFSDCSHPGRPVGRLNPCHRLQPSHLRARSPLWQRCKPGVLRR